jgi:phosphatidyl-myo-inositol dimannoside synthase
MRHLLVTNDYPPKLGGIQTYLWELWRRLPPDDVCVLTTAHPDAPRWDRDQGHRIERVSSAVLLPGPSLVRRIRRLVAETRSELVVLDPVLPLAPIARQLDVPYAVVVHGAELVVPANLPLAQLAVREVLRGACLVVAAGEYPALAARRAAGGPLPTVVVPPGVDTERFVPLDDPQRAAARERYGLDPSAPLVVSVSRLVPRKGMDVAVQAIARLAARHEGLTLAIAGVGRDHDRITQLAERLGSPVRMLGRIDDEQLPEVYGMGDVFTMLCRNRWGGLEQEGFGIVFLEAAAAGVAQVAGRSGGSADAVLDGVTGWVLDQPRDVDAATAAIDQLLENRSLAASFGAAGRARAVDQFDHRVLAARLHAGLESSLADRRSDQTSVLEHLGGDSEGGAGVLG